MQIATDIGHICHLTSLIADIENQYIDLSISKSFQSSIIEINIAIRQTKNVKCSIPLLTSHSLPLNQNNVRQKTYM